MTWSVGEEGGTGLVLVWSPPFLSNLRCLRELRYATVQYRTVCVREVQAHTCGCFSCANSVESPALVSQWEGRTALSCTSRARSMGKAEARPLASSLVTRYNCVLELECLSTAGCGQPDFQMHFARAVLSFWSWKLPHIV